MPIDGDQERRLRSAESRSAESEPPPLAPIRRRQQLRATSPLSRADVVRVWRPGGGRFRRWISEVVAVSEAVAATGQHIARALRERVGCIHLGGRVSTFVQAKSVADGCGAVGREALADGDFIVKGCWA